MKNFIQQHTQISREITVQMPVVVFERAFRQQIHPADTEEIERTKFKIAKENYEVKYHGWVSAYQFYVRPVFRFLNRSSIYFIIEGSYVQEYQHTKITYTIKPCTGSLTASLYFYTVLAIIGFIMSVYFYYQTKNNTLAINALLCISLPVLFTIFPYKMALKPAFQAFESDLINLSIS